MRMGELGKHVGDIELALEEFRTVLGLCEKYPNNNEQTLIAALFQLGKLKLDKSEIAEAVKFFTKSTSILEAKLRE